MKFIVSGLSMNMFMGKQFDLKVHELTEDEFNVLAYDAVSYVGQKDIAQILNVAYNREIVKTRVGDILLLAQKYAKDVLKFYCIQIVESDTPLLRSEEIYIDEEMI